MLWKIIVPHAFCPLSTKVPNIIKLSKKHCIGSAHRIPPIYIGPAASISTAKMSNTSLETIPKVDIDPSGVFKYILIKVHDPEQNNDDCSITIVRGYKRCNYHSDIYDEVQPTLEPFEGEPLGGGRMSHDPEVKKIHIYGYSQGYGKADHECTAKLVKEAYPCYKVTVSDEGY